MQHAVEQVIGREGETATLLLRCPLNFGGLGGGFAPRQLRRYTLSGSSASGVRTNAFFLSSYRTSLCFKKVGNRFFPFGGNCAPPSFCIWRRNPIERSPMPRGKIFSDLTVTPPQVPHFRLSWSSIYPQDSQGNCIKSPLLRRT